MIINPFLFAVIIGLIMFTVVGVTYWFDGLSLTNQEIFLGDFYLIFNEDKEEVFGKVVLDNRLDIQMLIFQSKNKGWYYRYKPAKLC